MTNSIINTEMHTNLSTLLEEIKNKVFTLAVRFLNDFTDAEDATQDILVRILKNHHTLKDSDKFIPWCMKVATNHLINLKQTNNKFQHLSFEIMELDCNIEIPSINDNSVSIEEKEELLAELKISCSHAMLMCLTKEERIIYVLSSMLHVNSSIGAEIMNITPESFRKKLSRAKNKLKNFLQKNCGLINNNATCKCRNRIFYALENDRISKDQPIYLSPKYLDQKPDIHSFVEGMEKISDFSDVFTSNPEYNLPGELKEFISARIM